MSKLGIKSFIENGKDTVEKVIKKVIMKFQSNPVTHIHVISTSNKHNLTKNFNPKIFLKNQKRLNLQ